MPDVIFNGPDGRLEGRYQLSRTPNAPIALILHPHPQHGGTMNNKVVYTLLFKGRACGWVARDGGIDVVAEIFEHNSAVHAMLCLRPR